MIRSDNDHPQHTWPQTQLGGMANGVRTATCHWFSMHATVPTLPHANRCSSSSAARHDGVATTGGPTLPILKAVRGVIFSSSSAALDDVLVSDSALTLPARGRREHSAQVRSVRHDLMHKGETGGQRRGWDRHGIAPPTPPGRYGCGVEHVASATSQGQLGSR
jgi:hypothetical protein